MSRRGIGVVAWIAPSADGHALLDSLGRQSRAPAVLTIAGNPDDGFQNQVHAHGGRFLPIDAEDTASAWNAAFAVAREAVSPAGWMFLDHDDRLEPDALECLEKVFSEAPNLGLVSCWTGIEERPGHLHLPPNPGLPHQWLASDAARATAFRAEAVLHSVPFGKSPVRGAELWDLTLSVLVDGWAAVTYPAMLARRACDDLGLQWSEVVAFRERRLALMRQFAAALVEDAPALVDLYVPVPAKLPVLPPASTANPGRPNSAMDVVRGPKRLRHALRRLPAGSLLRRLARLIRHPQRVGYALQRPFRHLAASIQSTLQKQKETQ